VKSSPLGRYDAECATDKSVRSAGAVGSGPRLAPGRIIRPRTTMTNPYLPQEILDYIIDTLHDEPEALKRCCLVSKPWVPRTRKYLFTHIEFQFPTNLWSWKKTFPDVANSPAYHARALTVGYHRPITTLDGEEGGWIRAFSGVKNLVLNGGDRYNRSLSALTPFHIPAPTLKSLQVDSVLLPFPGLFNFIISFPLLEDLSLTGFHDPRLLHGPQAPTPSTSPPLNGTLDLHQLRGVGGIAPKLLDLPNGLHFRKLMFLRSNRTDIGWITELVMRCSHTLEFLGVAHARRRTFI